MEYLSHVGLKLERMLAFIQTKNKVIKDEEVLIKGAFNRSEQNEIYKPPTWLGLNPKEISFENSQASSDAFDMAADEETMA